MAAPTSNILVARASGTVELVVGGVKTTAHGAQMLVPESTLRANLETGEELLLVFTSDGHQEVLKGPGSYKIEAGGCTALDGGQVARGKAVSRQAIAVQGSNLNRVGGSRQRHTDPQGRYKIPGDIPIRDVAFKTKAAQPKVEVRFMGRGAGPFWVRAGNEDVVDSSNGERGKALNNPGVDSEEWVTFVAEVPVTEPDEHPPRLRLGWLDEEGIFRYWLFRIRLLSATERQTMEQAVATVSQVESPLARHLLAMAIYDDYDQLPQAIAQGEAALKLSPGDQNLHADMARMLSDAGRFREARQHAKKIQQLVQGNP